MYVKVEPSGCCERKGMVQVRLAMYLDPTDYGYDKHHVKLPLIPESGYIGEIDSTGRPTNLTDYRNWFNSLPKVWQLNPFHNHFIYVEPDTTDEEIMDIAEAFLHEAGIKWCNNAKLDLTNNALPFIKPAIVTSERKTSCETRATQIKNIGKIRNV